MISRSVGIIAATALTAGNAFLIPPNFDGAAGPIGIATLNTKWQSVKLPCPECVFSATDAAVDAAEKADDVFTIQGGANSLMVNISTFYDGYAVGLENYPLYPPIRSFAKPAIELVADNAEDKKQTVYVTHADEIVIQDTVTPQGDAIINLKWQIRSIDMHPVTVAPIQLTVMKTADKKVQLINVQVALKKHSIFDSLPGVPAPTNEKAPVTKPACNLTPMLCKFKQAFEAKLNELSSGLPGQFQGLHRGGCAGKNNKMWKGKDGVTRLPSHIRPHMHMDGAQPDSHHGRPHNGGRPMFPHHHPHHPHHPHHHHNTFHSIVRGFLFFLVPMMLGVTMGMIVSVIGLLVGKLIAFVWIRFVRGGKRGYASVRLDEAEADDEEAKDVVERAASEDLPRYEEAPAYSEKETL